MTSVRKNLGDFVEITCADIARKTAHMGEKVLLDASVLDRRDSIALGPPGLISPNGSCRLFRIPDAWMAVNLPREDDLQSVAALLEIEDTGDAWGMLTRELPKRYSGELMDRAELLGLAIARVGEMPPFDPCRISSIGDTQRQKHRALRVVDLSSLWAGPLCGSIFAAMGADVTKIESAARPDPTPVTAPLLDQRLNGRKARVSLDFSSEDIVSDLLNRIQQCDVLITSARARALDNLGLSRAWIFARNPTLIWVAVTGYGWESNRIAFGDDAAAAGGLVDWENQEPHLIGDALADPLTGLAAAAAALDALQQDGGAFIDVALARTAAFAASAQTP